MRNLRENKHNKVCDLTGQSAFKTFFFNADGLLIDVMKRSASFDRVYSYDDLDRLASWTGGAYTHDVAGNVTRIERGGRPTLDLSWNSQYQFVSVATNGAFAGTPQGLFGGVGSGGVVELCLTFPLFHHSSTFPLFHSHRNGRDARCPSRTPHADRGADVGF